MELGYIVVNFAVVVAVGVVVVVLAVADIVEVGAVVVVVALADCYSAVQNN